MKKKLMILGLCVAAFGSSFRAQGAEEPVATITLKATIPPTFAIAARGAGIGMPRQGHQHEIQLIDGNGCAFHQDTEIDLNLNAPEAAATIQVRSANDFHLKGDGTTALLDKEYSLFLDRTDAQVENGHSIQAQQNDKLLVRFADTTLPNQVYHREAAEITDVLTITYSAPQG